MLTALASDAAVPSVSSDGAIDLTSPTHHVQSFPPSPSYPTSGDEYDLASPVALPESPSPVAETRSLAWSGLPKLVFDDEAEILPTATTGSYPRTASMSVPRPRHRSYASPPRTSSHSKAPRSVHAERKPKAKHGGIYSLLLKQKPPEHEAQLVDDILSPEVLQGKLALCVAPLPRLEMQS